MPYEHLSVAGDKEGLWEEKPKHQEGTLGGMIERVRELLRGGLLPGGRRIDPETGEVQPEYIVEPGKDAL